MGISTSGARPQQRFRVRGGRPVGGTFRPSGNKNEALPAVAAALLTEEEVVLENIPDILDVRDMVEMASRLGCRVRWTGPSSVAIAADTLAGGEPSPDLARQIRGSFLFSAPLLHRTRSAGLPRPGGDRIGRRRIDTHLLALRALGAHVTVDGGYRLELPEGFRGADVFLDEASVMATENAVMAAAVAAGETRIHNAASEPHVQGLCRMLNTMGARIRGIGTNRLEIEGVSRLHGGTHRLGADHIEVGSFIAAAAATGGELRVTDLRHEDYRMIRLVFERLGVATRVDGDDLVVPGGQTLEIAADIHDAIPKVDDAPWPGFPADLVSIAIVTAARSRGVVVIHEKLFESRLFFVDRLITMGAKIVLCDPHRVVVIGPSELHGEVIASPDIRAGMALLIAALCARGESTIHNIQQIDRGYERVDERLRELGADIERCRA